MSDVKVTIPRDDYKPNQRTSIDVEVVNPDGTVSTRTVKGAVQSTTQEDGSVSFGILASAHVPFTTFSPSDVAGLAAWWDVSTITGKSNGDTVPTLTDQSGNGITLTANGTPEYRTNIGALSPCVYMNPGSFEYFEAASASDLDLTGDFLCIGVFYIHTAARGATASNKMFGKDYTRYEFGEYQNALSAYVGGTPNNMSASSQFSSGTAYLVALRRTGTSALTARKNSAQIASATNSASATGAYKFNIGRRASSASSLLSLDGAVAEMLVYDADVSASDLASIESYLTAKWGL